MTTDIRTNNDKGIPLEELVPYYENVHSTLDLASEAHMASTYACGAGLTSIEVPKRITLLSGVRIQTFNNTPLEGTGPSLLLPHKSEFAEFRPQGI